MTEQRVLVTGHRGYIGSVLVPTLVRRGHDVIGFDTGYFDECTLVPDEVSVPAFRADIRDVQPEQLRDFDAVIHLAALSNDPIGNLDADWTRDINLEATVRLAELARDAGVRRFLFSSSCIIYGAAEADVVDETAPADPKTEYARSKVQAERALAELATDSFSPTFLRNGTVYGLSPRMRFDTVLNDLVASAFTTGVVRVYSDGTPWRPVIHVADVAESFAVVLEAPLEHVHNETFNNGADHLNRRVLELAEAAVSAVPNSKLEVLAETGADQRTYRADFSKFERTFPDFEFGWDAEAGARGLADDFGRIGLTLDQYDGPQFVRLRWLRRHLDEERLDADLRWTLPVEVSA